MYAPERQLAILEIARRDGSVEVRSLAEQFAVTPETIRRDLTAMERRGLVRRAHGGAIPIERLGVEPAVADRDVLFTSEKERIAAAALAELPDGGSIILDAGTTTARLAALLPTDLELTVVTHSIPIAATLAAKPNIDLHLLGGHVRHRTLATVGGWNQDALRSISADVAFLGINAISVERGLTTPDLEEARVKSSIIEAARRTVVLADSSKAGREDFALVAPLDRVDALITDSGIDPEHVAAFSAAGLEVVTA